MCTTIDTHVFHATVFDNRFLRQDFVFLDVIKVDVLEYMNANIEKMSNQIDSFI